MTTRWLVPFVLFTLALLLPEAAAAQCLNINSTPMPTTEEYGANRLRFKYLMTGPGSGDDRPEISKSVFTDASLVFNPQTTHDVHFTIRKNGSGGPVMWSTTMTPDPVAWTSTALPNGNIRWRYSDPAAPFGIKKAQLVEYVGGLHIWTYVRGVNQNIASAPLAPGVDTLHFQVEIENAGVGTCYEGIAAVCIGPGNTQTCYPM